MLGDSGCDGLFFLPVRQRSNAVEVSNSPTRGAVLSIGRLKRPLEIAGIEIERAPRVRLDDSLLLAR